MLRSARNYNMMAASIAAGVTNDKESMAIQSAKDECDINVIVKRFGVTRRLPIMNKVPLNEEFVDTFDFQSAMNVIRASQEAFAELPAEIRKRFGNDPGNYVEFCSDPKNIEELRKMGLAKAIEPEAPPLRVEVIPTPPKA